MLAADYPFLDVVWTMLIFFAWVIRFWLLITVFADLFRRHDIGGGMKMLWIIFVIIVPFLECSSTSSHRAGIIAERNQKQMEAQQAQIDEYVRETAGSAGAASEIEKAKGLLDSGAITQAEYDAIKQKALAQ